MERILIDIIGWTGTILYLAAYGLVSAKKAEADSWTYQGMNFAAGTMLIVNTLYLEAYPSVGLNVVWVGIAAATLGKKILQKRA